MTRFGDGASQLRERLRSGKMLLAPGAYDGLTAKLIEAAGFEAVYMTGSGTSAALGLPDYGLATMSEMVDNAGRIVSSVKLPVIADADTGYGNALNTIRALHAYERQGVAGIHIEDQASPKRCGHLDGKELVSVEDFVAKIRAAVEQRINPDFVIIARSDARGVQGFDAAVERVNAALAAGADMAFVEGLQSIEELQRAPAMVRGPCVMNLVHGGKTPDIALGEVERFGYRLTIVPGLLLKTMTAAAEEALAKLRSGNAYPVPAHDISVVEGFRRVGSDYWDALSNRYRNATPAPREPGENQA